MRLLRKPSSRNLLLSLVAGVTFLQLPARTNESRHKENEASKVSITIQQVPDEEGMFFSRTVRIDENGGRISILISADPRCPALLGGFGSANRRSRFFRYNEAAPENRADDYRHEVALYTQRTFSAFLDDYFDFDDIKAQYLARQLLPAALIERFAARGKTLRLDSYASPREWRRKMVEPRATRTLHFFRICNLNREVFHRDCGKIPRRNVENFPPALTPQLVTSGT